MESYRNTRKSLKEKATCHIISLQVALSLLALARDALAPDQTRGQTHHGGNIRGHGAGVFADFQDVDVFFIERHARIILVHGRDRRHSQPFLGRGADRTAADPVALGGIGRASQNGINLAFLNDVDDPAGHLIQVFGEIIVTADLAPGFAQSRFIVNLTACPNRADSVPPPKVSG